MDHGVETSVPPNPDPEASVPQFSTSGEASDRQPLVGPDPEGIEMMHLSITYWANLWRDALLKALEAG